MTKKIVLRRIIQIIIVLFGIGFLTFCLTFLAPGDPVRAMYAAAGAVPNDEVIESTREAMGLNEPFLVQYGNWLVGVLHGDFGTSYSQNKPVGEILLSRLWPTVKLALLSMGLMLIFAVPLGMLTAVKKGKAVDYLVRAITFLGVSMPSFWIGLLLMYFICLKLGWLPVVSNDTSFRKLILPAITLAISMTATYTRQVRAIILEELGKDYVIGAKSRGLKESTILWRHVFPNALLPLVTLLGLSFGSLLAGTTVVEVIFSYQGLGNLAVTAVMRLDYPLIQGYVLWIALMYMVINLLVDVSYGFLDPRTKRGLHG